MTDLSHSTPQVIITDFGLAAARQRDEDIYMYTPCGTPEYIAPEVVTRRPYTCSVDMWAVGVMTFIMLSGAFPFENSSRLRLYKLIMRAKFSFEGEVRMYLKRDGSGYCVCMAGETGGGGDREGPASPGPINSISGVGPGTQ